MIPYGSDHADSEAWADTDGVVIDLGIGKDVHSGQLRIAEKFVAEYTGQLLHVHGIGWHHWSGTHWVEDRNGRARRRVVKLYKKLRHDSVSLDKDDRDRLLSDVKKCESAAGIGAVLDIAKFMHPMTTSIEDTNKDPTLFNCRNGTYNLETGQIQPHDPADMITKCAGTVLEPDATSELWDDFLETVLPDPKVRAYLARVFGVALLGSVREHTLPILTGVGGNGKSVCVDTVMAAFGDYGLTVDPKLLIATRNERHGTFMADLQGARLVVTSETNDGEKLAAATVKRLTGGDRIRANRMGKDPFEFTPSHSLIMVTNHAPQAAGDDKALWRRLTVVPFDVVVEHPDAKLPDKLRGHLTAVLAWVCIGWLDYMNQGMNPPSVVVDRTEAYRSEGDPIGQFLEDQCVIGPLYSVPAKALFETWGVWAMRQGFPAMTQTDFGKRMTDRFEKKRSTGGMHKYVGVGLASDEDGML